MVIGIDAGALSVTDDRLKVGVYRVTKNALTTLAKIDKVNNYRLYTFRPVEEGIRREFEGRAEVVQLPQRGWQKIWLPLELRKHPVDAFLGLSQSLPTVSTLCDIGFIYDLDFLYYPEVYGTAARALKKQTEALVTRADHIVTISMASKRDILGAYRIADNRVSVIYPGVESRFRPDGAKKTLDRPYFLFVGSLNKAKDIPTLLAGFAAFCKENNTHDLVLVGGDYWPDPMIEKIIERFHLQERVRKLGVVPDEELPTYYRGATAFVTTALREGFCLPAAEAMASGCPVVAYDRGALAEVVGEGGIVIISNFQFPISKLKFAQAMGRMTDEATRQRFAKKAIVQSKKFRWEEFAKHVLEKINAISQGQAFQS